MIVPNSDNQVEQQQPASEDAKYDVSAAIKTDAKSTMQQGDMITTGPGEPRYLDVDQLKKRISFRELLAADGHHFKSGGSNALCCCPFHDDRNPSLSIFPSDAYAHCFGCGWRGNIYAYEMDYKGVDFTEAWVNLNEWLLKGPRTGRKLVVPRKEPKPTGASLFTQMQRDDRNRYAVRLETDPWIAERICQLRFERSGERWNPQTLRNMAVDGPLGWAGDCLAFMYATGTKFRKWPGKEFIWEGEGLSLWRRHGLASATHVYLTEGETDAIAMVDAGVEDDPNTTVIAVPGAGSFQPEWAEQFKGKAVTLCFDNDKAGEAGANKAGTLLQPYASEILTLNLGGAK